MSTTTVTGPIRIAEGPGPLDRHAFRSALRWLAFSSSWVWLGFVLFAVGITRSNASTAGVTESVVGSLSITPRNFLFAFAITILAVWFVPHVASGRTRRSLVTAGAAAVTVAALAYAVLLTVAFQVERPVYEANGWPLVIRTGHVFDSSDQVGLVLLESFVIAAAVGFAGLAVAAGYRRFGGVRGTVALLLTATPMLAATAALELRASSGLGEVLGVVGLSAPVTLAVIAALGALSLVTAYRLVHGAPATVLSAAGGDA
ncbi:MAG: hypothetical protein GX593_04705 [Actinomycetales bacterium]|nr:hypothetical protein [Actinomycetales bacterium]